MISFLPFYVSALFLLPSAFSQIKVLTSGGFFGPFEEVRPEFEKTTGITVTVSRGPSQGTGPTVIGAQLRRGVQADVVIMAKEGLDDLITEGRIAPKTERDLAEAPLGMSVRAGATKPDISTVETFKETLLRAKGITFPGSTTGIYLMKKLFPQLGVMSAIGGKITNTGVSAVASGDSEIAIQPVSELLHAPGADYVGLLPKEVQYISVFSAAVVGNSKMRDDSEKLIAFLQSDRAKEAIKKSGMEPANKH
jgi:molybdate transport system substrate-binding protein